MIGGWQLQGIMIFRSGVPYTVTMSRDVANTGVGGQRPNRIASGKSDNPTLAQWFDPAAFVAAPNFTYGNSGLRILSPDILRTVDFSLFKQFQISRALAPAIPLGGVQPAEHAELRGSQLDAGYGHRGAGHQHRYRAAANAGSLEADILTP